MPDDLADTVLIADNGTEETLRDRGEHAAPLSDGLIGLVGRLAVKEALTDVPSGQTAPPENEVIVETPGFVGIPMGKPLQLVQDRFYFIARCPVTTEILDAIPDAANGTGLPLIGEWRVACTDCDTTHALDLATIKSEQFVLPASHRDVRDHEPK